MSIWFKEVALEDVNKQRKNTILEQLDIQITNIGDDFIEGTMPADKRTFQPLGLVHGGANVVLAESLGSIAAMLTLDSNIEYCVGQEVNANHIRGVRSGVVKGIARAVHLGRTSQVWEIKMYNDQDKISCISRLTMAVIKR